MSLDDIRFEDRDKYRTERANTTVKYISAQPTKTAGGVGQGLMPYILAGSIGLGGGGFAGNALQEKITPTQLQAHIDRVVDKLERSEERIKEKLEDLEKELDDVRDKLEHTLPTQLTVKAPSAKTDTVAAMAASMGKVIEQLLARQQDTPEDFEKVFQEHFWDILA